jgi:hypothetical protein
VNKARRNDGAQLRPFDRVLGCRTQEGTMYKLCAAIAIFGLTFVTVAEPIEMKVHQAWVRKQPGYACAAMVEDNLGHVAVVSYSSSNTLSVLYDPHGRTVASAVYTQLFVTAVAANDAGKLVLAGVPPGYQTAAQTLIYRPLLSSVEAVTTGPALTVSDPYHPANVRGVTMDASNKVFLIGDELPNRVDQDYFVAAHDAGAISWLRYYQPFFDLTWHSAAAISLMPNGDVAAVMNADSKGIKWFSVSRYTADGEIIAYFETPRASPRAGFNTGVNAMCVDARENIYVGGWQRRLYGGVEPNFFVLKLATHAAATWTNSPAVDGQVYGMAVGPDGSVYVTGYNGTVCIDANGQEAWTVSHGGTSIGLDGLGNIYLALSRFTEPGSRDIETKKLTANGELLWSVTYAGKDDADDVLVGMIVRDGDGVYVAGSSGGEGVTIKYVDRGRDSILRSSGRK